MKKRTLLLPVGCILIVMTTALALSASLIWPSAPGTDMKQDNRLTVDASNSSDGYIMVKGDYEDKSYKLRIEHNGTVMTYDLNNSGMYEVFPLQFGSGSYKVSLYVQSEGKKYASAGTTNLSAVLSREDAAFLLPSQYVNYSETSGAVSLSDSICEGLNGSKEKYEAIRSYVTAHFSYDYIRSLSVSASTMPNIDDCVSNQMGISQDLAAMTACMLRVQGIPTRYVIGYLGKQYHAWNLVMIDGQEIIYDPTADLGGVFGSEYQMERYY